MLCNTLCDRVGNKVEIGKIMMLYTRLSAFATRKKKYRQYTTSCNIIKCHQAFNCHHLLLRHRPPLHLHHNRLRHRRHNHHSHHPNSS